MSNAPYWGDRLAREVLAELALKRARRRMARLGMPPESRWCRVFTVEPIAVDGSHHLRLEWLHARPHHVYGGTLPAAEGPTWAPWAGCRVDAFGELVAEVPEPTPWPCWQFTNLPPYDLNFRPWEAMVYPPDTPLYAELQWRPGYPDAKPYIGGWPSRRPGTDEIDRAWSALDLVWALERSRRRGRKRISRDDARRDLVTDAVLIVREQGMAALSIESLAESMFIDERTVSDRLDRAEWSMADLKAHPEVRAAARNTCN